jgi:hypothetical protein
MGQKIKCQVINISAAESLQMMISVSIRPHRKIRYWKREYQCINRVVASYGCASSSPLLQAECHALGASRPRAPITFSPTVLRNKVKQHEQVYLQT